jgi:8-oxo-dGTP pyrophosphatase MutT (NUDIX family)
VDEKEEALQRIAQAGAITFRFADGAPHILLVRAKKAPDEWIFPKGHLDKDETPEMAATRELKEEAGVRAKPLELIGSLDFQSGDEMVQVSYYLFQYLADVRREEEREIRWCAYDDALTLLSHRDAARLLEKALPAINSYIADLRSSQKRRLES